MGKRKLTDTQIINIANTYANGGDAINVSYLSINYSVSTSTISDALHFAISNCLINEEVANLIANKAVRNDNLRKEQLGYARSNKLADFYDKLLRAHIQKESNTSELQALTAKHTELRYQYDIFDESYSSSDEYPYTKEELKNRLDYIEDQIIKNKGHI